eukprot:6517591-Ditylum_brightwellii.AAC.1
MSTYPQHTEALCKASLLPANPPTLYMLHTDELQCKHKSSEQKEADKKFDNRATFFVILLTATVTATKPA